MRAFWRAECEAQVKGFAGSIYKKFKTTSEAESFIGIVPSASAASTVPSTSKTRAEPYPKTRPTPSQSSKGKQKALEPQTADRSSWLTVYSDGACKGNGQPGSVAGIGVWYGLNDPRRAIDCIESHHILTISTEI